MKNPKMIMLIAMLAAMSASAVVYHEVDFDTGIETLNNVNGSSGKIRFGGISPPVQSVSTNEWAGKVGDPSSAGNVNIVDDGTGTNYVLHLNGIANKTISTALVVAPEKFGATAVVAQVSFDLALLNKKGAGDASDGYLKIYKASGYDLSGVSNARIIIQCSAQPSGGSYVAAQNGATLTLLNTKQFSASDVGSTLSLAFEYDGSSAIIALWESQNKTEFKFDNVVFTDEGILVSEGDASIVMFGGRASVFDSGVATNNAFVSQIGAGEIVQWNGVNSDGGSFGASGTLDNQDVGASLTNTANGLILTTTAISSSNPARTNTVESGGQLGINFSGSTAAVFQQDDATEWSFEFNKQVSLKQVVFAGLDAALKDRMRVTVNGTDYDLEPADTDETDAWSGAGNTEVYTFPTSIIVVAGADITIGTHTNQAAVEPVNNKWGLYGVVVDVPYIDFGGNPNFSTNATYKAEMGGDTIVAWFGDDSAGRTNGIGNLANAGVGATLSAVDYGVTMTTMAISSSNPARTNTVQSGGQLGINFANSFNASFEAIDDTEWTFEFNKNVLLSKISFNAFAGTDEAEIIIGGVTNLITPSDTVLLSYESRSLYTFPVSVPISAGTDITVRAPVGKWGLRTLLIGLDVQPVTPASLYAEWLAIYSAGMAGQTNLTENPDGDALNNLYEYAQGGDPTTPDEGNKPVYSIQEIGGSNYLDYVFFEHADAAVRGLTYEVQLDDNLVTAPGWTNVGYQVIPGTVINGWRSVSNRVSMDGEPVRFIKLDIQFQ